MGAIVVSIIKNIIEVLVYVFIAWAGIVCGKKLSMNKKAKAQGPDTK